MLAEFMRFGADSPLFSALYRASRSLGAISVSLSVATTPSDDFDGLANARFSANGMVSGSDSDDPGAFVKNETSPGTLVPPATLDLSAVSSAAEVVGHETGVPRAPSASGETSGDLSIVATAHGMSNRVWRAF